MKKESFEPVYRITPKIALLLKRAEELKDQMSDAPLTPSVLASLRKTARLRTVHYTTKIEGNRLTLEQVREVLEQGKQFPGLQRDEYEIKGSLAALDYVQVVARAKQPVTQELIQQIHGLVMGAGRIDVPPTPYRDGQNVIQDGSTRTIVYLPPEASDVELLMRQLCFWVEANRMLPSPLVAAIAHYQCATVHPYYDGNGRTARLLATYILHRDAYDAKGVYSLDEYYGENLPAYYAALTVGPSHNYYEGRAQADITGFIDYFLENLVYAFEKVLTQMQKAGLRGEVDQSQLLRSLDSKKRKALVLFKEQSDVTAKEIGDLFQLKPRSRALLCQTWVEEKFLEVANPSKKARTYRLALPYEKLCIYQQINGIIKEK